MDLRRYLDLMARRWWVLLLGTLAFGGAMVELYENQSLRKTLAANARKEYEDNFNFSTIIKKKFIPLYEEKK